MLVRPVRLRISRREGKVEPLAAVAVDVCLRAHALARCVAAQFQRGLWFIILRGSLFTAPAGLVVAFGHHADQRIWP